MESSPRGRANLPSPQKKGVHIHVKLPSGTEVHEFILPAGYTVDQVKRAIFKQIPDLAKETNPNDYQLKLRDTLRSKEEILNVEFSKLQNLATVMSAADETPLELSILSTKVGSVRSQPTWAPTLWFNTRDRGALRPHYAADAHKRTFGHFESSWTLAGWRCITASHCPSQVSTRYASPAILHVECQPHKRFYWTHLAALYFASRHISPRHFNPSSSDKGQASAQQPTSVANRGHADVDTRDDTIKELQEQLARAHASVTQLNAKLARIGRLARLELLPLAANTPLTQLVNEDPAKLSAAVRENDIVASEKRLRSTLALVLAETERGSDEMTNRSASDDQVGLSGALAGASSLAGSVLTSSTTRGERAVSAAESSDAKRGRSVSTKASIDAIAGRMNLEVLTSSLASSASSPSTISGSAGGASTGSSPLPPRKILTPQERTVMLQQEFLDTEETYYKSLQKLHDHFEGPLEASGLLTPEQCDTLFSRVRTQLLEMHKHLLETIKSSDRSSFSDGLLVIAPYLKLYTEYVNNHPAAISLLIELNANSKKFAALLKQLEQKPEVESQDLSSYLIRPIQRLPRYEMLLRDMVKYTTEETEHLKLSRLLEAVKKVNEHLNEAKRKRDNSTKMAAIQSNLILGKAKGTRSFLRDDTLLVKKVKKEKTTFAKHHFFLFNDILLDTVKNREGKFKLAQVYSLSETSFMKYEGETDTVALFHTSSPESAEEDLAKAIHVKADQGGDIDGWLQDALDAKSSLRAEASKDGRFHVAL
ncbi:RhoGEF domain containing protein [Acanthamoeba castellanii str. Neff]|uniref:RhoGEF domain containing protein n=1 Tax=Acanthamoeba castellanii (strain ATCC 30010 / Neff) TaxID=1257118 RepID=L8HJ05_ACACF|nr:RhoGEF domain containing protein [Acanthamoeba castellanii str. Neff]ELR25197.1 RhoGEF domain containing protein [Acanthamoeba castellanii str. Neff]